MLMFNTMITFGAQYKGNILSIWILFTKQLISILIGIWRVVIPVSILYAYVKILKSDFYIIYFCYVFFLNKLYRTLTSEMAANFGMVCEYCKSRELPMDKE
jgi:uncharacterized membrane protein